MISVTQGVAAAFLTLVMVSWCVELGVAATL